MNQPDYLFAPHKSAAQRARGWAQLDHVEPRQVGRVAAMVVAGFLVLKGLIWLGLIFQFLLPLSAIAAAILGITQLALGIIAGTVVAIAICALIGFAIGSAWRFASKLTRRS